jgi:hypothetical protein
MAVAVAVLGVVLPALGLSVGQVDTFESGTTLNWAGGALPTNIPTDGPAGAGDHYLRLSSNNSGLASFNATQWTGNYLAAGITSVAMDLRNQGSTDLSLRLSLFNTPGGEFTTATAIPLPADNQWRHIVFGLSAADLAYVGGGTGNLSDALGSVGRLHLRHSTGAPMGSGQNTPVTGILGIDNITALPEPRTAVLLLAAAACCVRVRRLLLV